MTYHLLSKAWIAARKPHRCIWCCGKIAPTEVYCREASIYDGYHQNHAWHWDCWFDAQENYFRQGEEEFMPGETERPQMKPFRSIEARTAQTNGNERCRTTP